MYFNVYRNGIFWRRAGTLASAEDIVVKTLREGLSAQVHYNGHPVAEFAPPDLQRPVWGQPDTFLARDIERGMKAVENLPPAVRGKNRRAVVQILREGGMTEENALAALEQLRPMLK